MHEPQISVVIGAADARRTLAACLTAIVPQAQRYGAEVIVAVDASDASADISARQFPDVTLIRAPAGLLVPQLWALGVERARAPLVAITTAQCVPADDWLAWMLREAERVPAAGIGGTIDAPRAGSPADWAVYFVRYAAYMPPVSAGNAAEIPGDNALYRAEALASTRATWQHGFWETLVHHQLRAAGATLAMSPDVAVRFAGGTQAGAFVRARYRHGRHFGATRPGTAGVTCLVRALAAPALLPLLLLRIVGRVRRRRPEWLPQLVRALPWLLLFLVAWTAGEAAGYLQPRGR